MRVIFLHTCVYQSVCVAQYHTLKDLIMIVQFLCYIKTIIVTYDGSIMFVTACVYACV